METGNAKEITSQMISPSQEELGGPISMELVEKLAPSPENPETLEQLGLYFDSLQEEVTRGERSFASYNVHIGF